jgi:hypothetical protein
VRKLNLFVNSNRIYRIKSRYQWPRPLKRGSAAARLLELPFRIPPRVCLSISFSVVCCHVRSLRRTDHSSRGVIQIVVCLRFIADLKNDGNLDPLGLSSREGKTDLEFSIKICFCWTTVESLKGLGKSCILKNSFYESLRRRFMIFG